MQNWFCCLVVSGIRLSDEARVDLNEAARAMFRTSRNTQRLRSPHAEGRITTDFWFYGVGSICGVLFSAEVESEAGKGIVKYLFQPTSSDYQARKNENGEWGWEELSEEPLFVPLFPLGDYSEETVC